MVESYHFLSNSDCGHTPSEHSRLGKVLEITWRSPLTADLKRQRLWETMRLTELGACWCPRYTEPKSDFYAKARQEANNDGVTIRPRKSVLTPENKQTKYHIYLPWKPRVLALQNGCFFRKQCHSRTSIFLSWIGDEIELWHTQISGHTNPAISMSPWRVTQLLWASAPSSAK